jgi:hypothetical protein
LLDLVGLAEVSELTQCSYAGEAEFGVWVEAERAVGMVAGDLPTAHLPSTQIDRPECSEEVDWVRGHGR